MPLHMQTQYQEDGPRPHTRIRNDGWSSIDRARLRLQTKAEMLRCYVARGGNRRGPRLDFIDGVASSLGVAFLDAPLV